MKISQKQKKKTFIEATQLIKKVGVMVMFVFFMVFFIGIVSSAEFDNVKSYDTQTKTITIINAFNLPLIGSDIATIKLNTPQNYLVPIGYQKVAEFEVSAYTDYTTAFKEMEFYDRRNNNRKFNRSYDYKYKTTEQVPIYENVCDQILSKNGTIVDSNCVQVDSGRIKTKVVWKDFTLSDFKQNDILTIGIFTDVKINDSVEWIPNFFGIRINEWASWTSSLNVGLVSYYKLDGTTGGVNDSIQNFNGTNNGATRGAVGIINNSFDFTGSPDNVVVSSFSLSPSGSFSFWINVDSTVNQQLIDFSGISTGAINIQIFSSEIYARVDGAPYVTSSTISTGTWYHIVFTWDGTDHFLYLNNVSSTQVDSTQPLTTSKNMYFASEDVNDFYLDGRMDEIGIWNRSLSQAEVTQLYNGGAGITWRNIFAPAVTLNSPVDTFNSTSTTIDFNGTVTTGDVLVNVSLIIDDLYNETNTTSVTGDFLFTKILSEGNYNWTYEACDGEGCTNATTRTFTIDTIIPNINVTAPRGALGFGSLTANETLNWSVEDANLDTCFYDYNFTNTTITCGDNTTTFALTSQRNLTFYANDTVGNMASNFTTWSYKIFENNQTFTNPVTEGSSETFSINYDVDPGFTVTVANLSYNNTQNIGITVDNGGGNFVSNATITIPLVNADTNVTFFWNFTFSDSSLASASSNNQTIKNLNISDCSVNSNLLMNLTLVDEGTQAVLSGSGSNTTIEVDIDLAAFGTTASLINFSQLYNQTNPAEVCLNVALPTTAAYRMDSTILYKADPYSVEHYNIQNFKLTSNTLAQNITLFDLLTADNTDFRITFKDSNFVVVENALIQINRQYVSEGKFKTVEIPKTDSNGQTVAHLVAKDVVYNIIVIKEGEILGTFNNIVAFCDDTVTGACFITLNSLATNTPILDIDSDIGVASSFDYNETSRVLSYTFSVLDGSTKNVTLNAVQMDQLGNNTVCDETLISSSGVITCTVPGSVGNETIITTIFVNGVPKISTFISAGRDFDIGDAGFFLMFFFVLTFALIFMESKAGVIIGVILGFIVSALFSLTQGTLIGLGSAIIWLIVAGSILIWKLNKEGQT